MLQGWLVSVSNQSNLLRWRPQAFSYLHLGSMSEVLLINIMDARKYFSPVKYVVFKMCGWAWLLYRDSYSCTSRVLSIQGIQACKGSQTWLHMVMAGWGALEILIPKFCLQRLSSLVCFSFSSVPCELCAFEHVTNLCELSFLIQYMGIIKCLPHRVVVRI